MLSLRLEAYNFAEYQSFYLFLPMRKTKKPLFLDIKTKTAEMLKHSSLRSFF